MDKKLLADLYVLRAGLSEISLQKDKIVQEEKSLNVLKKAKEQQELEIKSIENSIINPDLEMAKFKPDIKYLFAWLIASIFIGIVGGGILHLLCVFIVSLFNEGLEVEVPEWLLTFFALGNWNAVLIVCSVIFAVSLIVTISIWAYKQNKEKKRIQKLNNERNAIYKKELKNVEDKKTQIFRGGAAIIGFNKSIQTQNEVYCSTSALLSASSKSIYDSLVVKFKSTLDIRDWKYLDLIIFYFETGRAETLKEALQQVDRRVQTNEIIGAIRNASASISKTIEGSMSSLQGTIQLGFNNLSKQLEVQHQEQMGVLNDINSSIKSNSKYLADISAKIDTTNKYIEKINTTSELSNALLAKINVDSTRIWDDVDYMLYKAPKIANYQSKTLKN